MLSTKIFSHINVANLKQKKKNQKKNQKKKSEEELKEYINNTFTFTEEKSEGINNDLFTKYFNFLKPSTLAEQLYVTKDKKKNNVGRRNQNRWSNLKDETKKISQEEIENEKPNQILETVNKIPYFNKEIKQQQALGLKILTPNQMLNRLPITLTQLKAGNNSEKLKNEIRQLLYSLYRSKKLSLVDII